MSEYKYIDLKMQPELKTVAANWFHEKWGVPEEAYLACMESDNPFIRYSGVFRALNLSLNKLRDINLDAYKEITSSLSDEFYEDCATHAEYWEEFEKEPEIAQAATAVNNTYLKANNQSDGVQSYGRMLDLLLAYYREK